MRVLVLTNLYPPDTVGGYELACRQAVDALRERGHAVRVLTTAPRTPVESPPHVQRALRLTDMWDHYSDSQSAGLALRLKELKAHQIDASNVHALLAALEEFRPDVVYLWMLVGIGGLGLLACLEHLRVPWVWYLGDEVPSKLCTLSYAVNPALARAFAREARGTYHAVSRQLVDRIAASGIDLGDRVEVITNWVTGPRPEPRGAFYRGGPLRVVASAVVIDRAYDKGIDLVVRAAGALRRAGHVGLTVDVFGKVTDGYYPGLVRELGLTDGVRFLGEREQSEMIESYRNYDLLAFPGRPGEPYGLAPLEALTRGCVPVMARDCGAAEWLVHGAHCLKAERSAEGFARAIGSVLDGSVDLEPVARRGEAAVWRDFHIGAIVPRIERALRDAAARPRDGAGSPGEAYRLAVLAEKFSSILMQTACAG